MSIWICKNNSTTNIMQEIQLLVDSTETTKFKDEVYVYTDDYIGGSFVLKYKYIINSAKKLKREEELEKEVDLPYSVLYRTKSSKNLIQLNESEIKFILSEQNITEIPFIEITFGDEGKPDLNFEYKNILLKGVPGTGKSHLIDETLIKEKLNLSRNDKNVLRINVHSASSNADLMQGIGINTTVAHDIEYKEKQGLILDHIQDAVLHPKQAFVLVLEEIQENSLNELIGDLIYLIEPSKRTNIAKYVLNGTTVKPEYADINSFDALIDKIVSTPLDVGDGKTETAHFVEIPSLVSAAIKKRKMIFPDNLYVFCTSNFREDKKVIEDNLLRRFDTIEIYPNYSTDAINNLAVSRFLATFNKDVLKKMKEEEIHPDRFLIGHAIWKDVHDATSFYRALLKVVVEFKDVKELEYDNYLKSILSDIDSLPFNISPVDIKKDTYKDLIEFLQNKSYDFLPTSVIENAPIGNTPEQNTETVPDSDSSADENVTEPVPIG